HRRGPRSRREANTQRVDDSRALSGLKLYEDVIAYYNLGEHRTATEVDQRTSEWLIERLRAAGLKATFQSFSLRQFFVRQTRLTITDKSIRVFPLWFPRSTGPDPINGTMAVLDKNAEQGSLRGKLAIVKFPAEAAAATLKG